MKNAGWYAIISGIMGILGYGFLIGYLISRSDNTDTWILMNRLHDAACVFQFLLLVPVVSYLHNLFRRNNYNASRITFSIGIAAALATSLFLMLIFPKLVSDILYMIPQGVFGVWLIAVNWHKKEISSNTLRIFGIIVGTGLLLTGIFPLGFAFFVSIDAIKIPAASLKEFPRSLANNILHILLFTGSLMGVLTLPFWTIFFGMTMLKPKPTLP